jgi:hypothetical protein
MKRPWLAWLSIPVVGILELVAHAWLSVRAPEPDEWSALPELVARLRHPGDLVVVAPEWAEPLARHALGDPVLPISALARADVSGYAFALEVSVLGARAAELARFSPIASLESPPFRLRRLRNDAYSPVLFAFTDHVAPEHLSVTEPDGDGERECSYTERAGTSSGGLGGHPTYPASRFRCTGGESFFVGVTLLDDQNYRPRRCIFAHPPRHGGPLRLRFPNVPKGTVLTGSAGFPYLLFRDGLGQPVTLAAFSGDRKLGESTHRDEDGFKPFRFELGEVAARSEIRFEVTSTDSRLRHFCFTAEVR